MSRLAETLLIVLGIIIVCIAGLWVWSWATSKAPAPSTQAISTGGAQFPSQVSVGASSSGQPQTQTQTSQTAPDINSSYIALFSQLGAEEATFVPADASSTGDLGDLYALYANDVTISQQVSPGAPDYSVDVALTDLNGDGTDEALVLEDLPGFCGTEGCPLDIYQKQGAQWTKIFSNVVQGDVGLSNVYVDEYQNLLLTVPGASNNQGQVLIYSWDGKTYQPGQTVATWNGTTFQLAQ